MVHPHHPRCQVVFGARQQRCHLPQQQVEGEKQCAYVRFRRVGDVEQPTPLRPLSHLRQIGITILDRVDEAAEDTTFRRQRRAEDIGNGGDDQSNDAED